MKASQIGLQLYTVRDLTQTDMIGTLRQLAAAGYRMVEFAGYGNSNVKEVRQALDDLGMQAIAAHIALDRFESGTGAVLDELHTLGARFAVLPWLAPERRNADDAKRLADSMNAWAAQCRGEGLGFAYHNHDFEFQPAGDCTLLDILLGGTNPELVKLEFDVYWAAFAGHSPADLIRQHPQRMSLLHMKDMADNPARSWAIVGEGTLPWPDILSAAAEAGSEWYIVEHDRPSDPLNDVTRGLRNLEAWAE